MNQKRAFILVNVILASLCLAFAYYIWSAAYSKPLELQTATDLIEDIGRVRESGGAQSVEGAEPGATPTPAAQSTLMPDGSGRAFDPVITLTPAPTESPRPTATPYPIKMALQTWTLDSLDTGEAGVKDTKNGDSITMTVGGTPHTIQIDAGSSLQVILKSVDLDNNTATFQAGEQEMTIAF